MAASSRRVLALFLTLGLVLAACSSSDESGDAAEATAAPSPTATVPPVDESVGEPEPTTTVGQAEEVGADEFDLESPIAEDAWTTAVADVDDEGARSLDSALALFTIVYGDLPGAPAPVGELADTTVVEGTTAIHAVLGHWGELTPEQQTAVRVALELPTDWVPGSARPTGLAGGAAGVGGVAGRAATAHRGPTIAADADQLVRDYQALADQILPVMESHFGMLGFTPVLALGPGNLRNPPEGDTITIDSTCRIRMFAAAPAPADAANVMAHELFHCFQMQWSPDGWPTLPDWRIEGMAEWAGVTIAHEMGYRWDVSARTFLGEYYVHINRSLFARSYDATTWFHHVEDRGVDLFDLASQVFTTPGNADAYTLLTSHAAADYARTWATGDLHQQPWGADWYHGFTDIIPDTRNLALNPSTFGNGDTVTLTSARAGTARRVVDVSAEITTFSASDVAVGTARISDADRALADLLGQDWCTGEGSPCVCPPGTAQAGRTFPRLDGGQHVWAFTGELSPASVTVQGRSLRDICGPEDHCLVGTWQMTDPWVMPGFSTNGGGTGLRLFVTSDGQVTFDYNELSQLIVTRDGTTDEVRLDMWGAGHGRIDLDATDGTGALTVTELDWTGLSGSGSVWEDGELAIEFGEEFVTGIVAALSYDTLFALSECTQDTLTVFQSTGESVVSLPFHRLS